MGSRPNYAIGPDEQCTSISSANTNRDGTGTISTIFTPSTKGGKVQTISAKAKSSTAAGCIVFYTSDDSGTTWVPWKELTVSAITPSTTVPSWEGELLSLSKDFSANGRIGASTTIAQAFGITVEFANF